MFHAPMGRVQLELFSSITYKFINYLDLTITRTLQKKVIEQHKSNPQQVKTLTPTIFKHI